MNFLVAIAQSWTPEFLKKREMNKLFRVVGKAFGYAPPRLRGLSYSESLKMFAEFTSFAVERADGEGRDLNSIRSELFDGAQEAGRRFRRVFGASTTKSVMDVARMIYQLLGIEFQGSSAGEVEIPRCYFAQFYSPQTCAIISGLDEGLLSGLSGGGTLVFSQRISEGHHHCTARLQQMED